MGLLEDAIREHLDLKRQRGADPSEVSAEEREALGPGLRLPAPAAEPGPADEAGLLEAEELEGDPLEGPSFDDELIEPAPAADPDRVTDSPADEIDPFDEPFSDPQPPRQRSAAGEDDLGDADVGDPDAAAEEDVLEETPEFLEDTPEHDRLWFEQRPPRDFDFGG